MLLVEAPHLASIRWPRLSSIASMADNRCERRQVEGVHAREGEGARRATGGRMEGRGTSLALTLTRRALSCAATRELSSSRTW